MADRLPRFWFWKPERYWFGWGTLSPIHYFPFGDESGRATLLLGWTVTGRVIIALSGPRWPENEPPDEDDEDEED